MTVVAPRPDVSPAGSSLHGPGVPGLCRHLGTIRLVATSEEHPDGGRGPGDGIDEERWQCDDT